MKIYPKIPSRRINQWAQKRQKNRWVTKLATGIFILFLAFTASTIVAFAWLSKDLPSPYKLTDRDIEQSTQIFDRNGELLYDIYGDKNRTLVALKDIPQYLKDATISIEDKSFYTHKGFDPLAVLRVAKEAVVDRSLSGGSTLTQQLVKNALLSNERTVTRKIKEFILSVQIERRYTKDEILQIYFNEVPYGGTAWGAEAGARLYFNKSVKEVNLLESAILAGLPQLPTYYSPYGANPDAYKTRTAQVLRRMKEDGYITTDVEKKALSDLETYKFQARSDGLIKAPHFSLYVRELLVARYGEKLVMSGGLKVTTTLDYRIQEAAQKIVADQVASEGKNYRYSNAAAMVTNPKTGEVLAMVGSKDYFAEDYDGQYNVTTALRQPGSSIKPINYVTGLKKGYTAATLFVDQKTDFPCPSCPGGAYTPQNGDRRYGHGTNGLILMRNALGESLNLPAVKMLALNGITSMMDTARDLGITTFGDPSNYGLSLTLGAGEVKMLDMMVAYSAFANGGLRVDSVSILKVTDSKGKVLEEFKPTPGQRVLDAGHAFIINDILADANAKLPTFGRGGVNTLTVPGKTVAVKTGTTDDIKDNWAMGYTPSFVVGAWVGNNDNTALSGRLVSGLIGGAPIWKKIFVKVFEITKAPEEKFQRPDNVVQVAIDAVYGTKPIEGSPTKLEWFTKNTVPGNTANVRTLRLCKDQKKLATPADEAAGQAYDQVFVRVSDSFSAGQWVPFDPPTDKCTAYRGGAGSNEIAVGITSPANGATVGTSFTVSATAVGPYPITRVEFFLDGNLVGTSTTSPYSYDYGLPATTPGAHTVSVKAYDTQGVTGSASISVTVGAGTPEPESGQGNGNGHRNGQTMLSPLDTYFRI